MTHKQLEEALFNAAEAMATRHRVQFGQGADSDIRRLAREGAARILDRHGVVKPDDLVVAQATLAFERLVVEMVSASLERPGYQIQFPGIIGEETLREARLRLCPLFPIC